MGQLHVLTRKDAVAEHLHHVRADSAVEHLLLVDCAVPDAADMLPSSRVDVLGVERAQWAGSILFPVAEDVVDRSGQFHEALWGLAMVWMWAESHS